MLFRFIKEEALRTFEIPKLIQYNNEYLSVHVQIEIVYLS